MFKYNSQTRWPEDRNNLGWMKPKDFFPPPVNAFGLLVGPMLKIIVHHVTPTMVQYEDMTVQEIGYPTGFIHTIKQVIKDS